MQLSQRGMGLNKEYVTIDEAKVAAVKLFEDWLKK